MRVLRLFRLGAFCIVMIGCVQPTNETAADGFLRDTMALDAAPDAVAVVDLDADGNPDLIVAAEVLRVFKGDGAGGFSSFGETAAGENPVDIAVGDINGDGRPDIAIANHDTDYLTILVSDGSRNLTPHPQSPLQVNIDPHPHAVHLADMNNDGRLDLLVDNRNAHSVRILYGDGRGGFERPGVDIPIGGDPYRGFALGDLNNDGRLDLITPNENAIGVILAGAEGYEVAPSAPIAAPAPSAVNVADMNGDGNLDIIVVSSPSGAAVFLGDGSGRFAGESDFRFDSGSGEAHRIAVGDFNADGHADAVIVGWDTPEITILLGGETVDVMTVQTGRNPWGLAAADLNGDGCGDIAVGAAGDRTLEVYLCAPAFQPE